MIGYFRISSFKKIAKLLNNIDKVKILVGINIEKLTYEAQLRGKKYLIVIQSWKNKWYNISVYFKYPEDIRRIIYTTNIIESVHRQFKKLTKTKDAFPKMRILF